MIYIVTYTLADVQRRNYDGLYTVLRSSFDAWMHYVNDSWFIATNQHMTAEAVYNLLAPHIQNDCSVIVIRVMHDYFGNLPNDAWDWLEQHASYY